MSGFTRRYNFLPDAATIKRIEGVIIVDAPPAGDIQSAESGLVCLVGETEDGGFATDPLTPVDLYHPAGGLIEIGDGGWSNKLGLFGFTIGGVKYQHPCARRSDGEYWNGNAYVQAKGLPFRRFMVARVDTSVGSVTFSPLAFLESSSAGPWALTSGQTLVLSVNGGADRTGTFTGTAAAPTGAAATYAIVAGDTLVLAIDGAAAVTVTFQAGDTTVGAVVSRINAAMGQPIASNSAGQVKLTSPTGGTASKVQVVSGSALTALGLTAATTSGTGNVANIGAVTAAEVKTIIEALTDSPKIRTTADGKIRLCSPLGSSGTIRVQVASTATAFGFTTATTVSASSGSAATSIPAGTLVSDGTAANRVVTMQTLQVPANTTAAISVKVRPALDDGTFALVAISGITKIETVPSLTSEWTVNNAAALTAALTGAQKDAAYQAALNATLAIGGPSRKINYIVSARQSPALRLATRANALNASAKAYGRKACVSPPLGTSLTTMVTAASPGVGTYRDERVSYQPGWSKYMSEIAALGSAIGGAGFTDTGIVETHGDIVAASVMSVLPPEENPAQTQAIIPRELYVGVEAAISTWGESEYALALANGIMAPVFDEIEGPQFMSGVTSVDPASYPSQVPIARVRLADYLTDSVADFQKPYVKKNASESRKALLLGKLEELLGAMKTNERISDYEVSEGPKVAKNTFTLLWRVEPLESMDQIINQTSIGVGSISTARVGA